METPGLKSVSDLVREAYEFTKAHGKTLYGISVILYVGYALFLFAAASVRGTSLKFLGNFFQSGSTLEHNWPLLALFFLVFMFFSVWVEVAMLQSIIYGRGFRDSFSESKHKVLSYLGTDLLVGLMVLFGIILLIVPGIIWAIWYTFAPVIVVAESIGGWEALKKSKSYVVGRWSAVAWRVAVLALVFGIAEAVVGWVVGKNLSGLTNAIIGFLTLPLVTVYHYILYKNLKETMSISNQPQPVPVPTQV
jgi:hypothetical protein